MNHPPDMLRQQSLPHLSGNMLNSQHFLQQSQQPQSSSSQPHPIGLLPNASNPNPSISIGNSQPQNMAGPNPTPVQMYLNQQRRAQALLSASQTGHNMSGNSHGAPHMNGIGPSQAMGYQNQMMPLQPVRRVVSQPQGMNQPGVNHMGGMPGQQNMSGITGLPLNPQGMAHPNMRIPPQQMNPRIPQQQQQAPQMPGQMSPEMNLSLNRGQPHMQGNPGIPPNGPRPQQSQPPLMGGLPQPQSIPPPHPAGMQPSMHQLNYQNQMSMSHQQPSHQMGQSPHSGSYPQSQPTGNMAMQQPLAGDAQNRARMTPDNSIYMHPSNQQFPQGMPPNNRMPNSGNQFGFSSAPTPPDHDLGNGLQNPSGPPRPAGFHLTSAQQFQMQQQRSSGDINSFHLPPSQPHAPPRPPSHNPQQQPMPLQPSQPSHQSPEHMNMNGPLPNLQRPQSQPQIQHGSISPPSQPVLSRTPHMNNPPLPGISQPGRMPPSLPSGNGGPPGPNLGSQPGPPQPPQQSMPQAAPPPGQTFPMAVQRPSQTMVPSVPGPSVPPPPSADATSSQMANNPHKVNFHQHTPLIGSGQGVVRLLSLSGLLSTENKNKLQLPYWKNLVDDYFTPKAVMKYTLWKDSQRNEAKLFDIGVPILPRFFLVTSQSGVRSMSISLDGARERNVANGHAIVECGLAVWTYKYTNGYTIHLRGPLTAHIWAVPMPIPQNTQNAQTAQPQFTLKIDHLQFDANFHDKYVTIDAIVGQRVGKSPNVRNAMTPIMNGIGSQQQQPDGKDDRIHFERSSLPGDPVNAFGVPQATMRCLELAESVAQMTDLIQFSFETGVGPLLALKQFADKIRENQTTNGMRLMGSNQMNGTGFPKDGSFGAKTLSSNSPVTLYHGTPATSVPNGTHPAPTTPQNPPPTGDANSPSKQNKASTQQAPSSAPSSSTPTSTPSSTAPNTTPNMAAVTLKRKAQTDTSSPTTDHPPPPKRPSRKRRG